MKQVIAREQQNLQFLAILCFLIPMIWMSFLGWSTDELIAQHDNLTSGYIYSQQFIEADGDWEKLLYWPQIMGGVKVHDITGSLPIVELMIKLGAGFVTISNFSVFFVQILFAYFCVQIMKGLSCTVLDGRRRENLVVLSLVGVLFAFLPVLGWRLTHGHLAIVLGLFVFLCMTSMLLDEINSKRSSTSLVLALIALVHTFEYNGFQTMYYSVLLGAPIVIGLALSNNSFSVADRCRWFIFPLLVFLSGLLICLPKLYSIIDSAFGDEVGRAIGQSVIYSYTTATVSDWISSIPWSAHFIPSDRANFLHHEVNYPLGAMILLLFLCKPTSRLIYTYVGLSVSIILALVISMNIQPLSDGLLMFVPLLDAFRVPARAILPALVFVLILAITILVQKIVLPNLSQLGRGSTDIDTPYGVESGSISDDRWKPYLLILLAIALASFLPVLYADLLIAILVVCLFLFEKKSTEHPEVYLLALAIITGSAITAFDQRAYSPIVNPITDINLSPIRDSILVQAPELADTLNRARTDLQLTGIGLNSAFVLGLSTMSGYWFPTRRYSLLYSELHGTPYSAATTNFQNINIESEGHSVLNRLYNVGSDIDIIDGQLIIAPLERTLGKAWFTGSTKTYQSISELAAHLKEADNDELERTAMILAEDTQMVGSQTENLICKNAKIEDMNNSRPVFPLEIKVAVDGDCLLNISMNYSELFSATDQAGHSLDLLPTYGALLGIMVPNGTSRVTIVARANKFTGSTTLSYLGFLMALILLVFTMRQSGQK